MDNLGNKKIFSKNLKYYMELHHLTRNDIAKITNVPYSTVASWCNGLYYPRIDKIELLANYFNILKSDLVDDKQQKEESSYITIPILGCVKAGYDYLAEENHIGRIQVDNISDINNCFALKVVGDSMEPVLYENDIVIVHKQENIESSEIAIVMINDEVTIKKIITNKDSIELIAFNPYYPPKKYERNNNNYRIQIIGKVIEARIKKVFE